MTMRYGASAALGAGVLVGVALQLAGCKDEGVVARLVDHAGQVRAAGQGAGWEAVEDGAKFRCDDRLQTGAGAWARVDIAGSGRVRLEPDTTIRFACAPGQPAFDLEIGEAVLSSADGDAAWVLEIGNARLQRGTEMRIRAGDRGTRFQVVVGRAEVERVGGGTETMAPGDALEIEIGAAEVRRVVEETETEAEPGPGAEEVADAGVADPAPPDPELSVEVRGRRNQVRLPGERRWSRLPPGAHTLAPGTRLRLGRGGAAEIAGGAGKVGLEAPGELVVGSPDEAWARAERGGAWMQAEAGEVAMDVPGGRLQARPGRAGARARVDVARDRARVRALRGAVDIAGKGGARESLGVGERAELTHGGRILRQDRAPARAEVMIQAGESPVVHDPQPPTAVGIRFDSVCAGADSAGVVEVSGNSGFRGETVLSKGNGRANVRIDQRPRVHHYRVRCIEDGVLAERGSAGGTIRVMRDAGTRRLPRSAPTNTVDADGRRYTVLYQNRLPQITFRWPQAAEPGPYRLHLVPARGQARDFSSARPSVRVNAGALDEGTYQYYFEAAGARSRTSVLRIDFDNAAPSAYLRQPGVRQAWQGDTLALAGAALPGSRVSVNGTPVPLDRQARFSAQLALPIAGDTVAVRLAHPRQGVHYYLRRNRGRR